jgi:peptidoglycan-associated lipoprotein
MRTKFAVFAVFAVLVMSACAKKQIIKPEEPKPVAAVENTKTNDAAEPSVRFSDWEKPAELCGIVFDFDKSELSDSAKEILEKNTEYLKANPGLNVLIEGHCDERGTIEYNLALGQRRAMIVKEYYVQLGVPLASLATISYGSEKPENPGHNEAAWAQNRRAETKVRSK